MGARFLWVVAAGFAVESMVAQYPRLSPGGLGGFAVPRRGFPLRIRGESFTFLNERARALTVFALPGAPRLSGGAFFV